MKKEERSMKLGILNAIPPESGRVDWKGTPVDGYIRFLQSAGAPFTYAGYQVAQGELPASPEECDAYVISGSPKGVYDEDPWIGRLAQFIRDCYQANRKLIGICFGHQILAHALGGLAEKSQKGWGFGMKQIEISGSKTWMNGEQPEHCSLYFAHQDQVVQLPPGAELLGGSEFCPNAFYTIDGRALGIQGHPEFSREIMSGLIATAGQRMDPQVVQAAYQSLEQGQPDNLLLARWIVSFLTD
jgi:GMP synthase-like glutamine amidotransferase